MQNRKTDSEVRNVSAAESLFLEVLEVMNRPGVLFDTIPQVLERICGYFSFGGAFVYEQDHTQAFWRKEYFEAYDNAHLRDKFSFKDFFTPAESKQLAAMPVLFYNKGMEKGKDDDPDGLKEKAAQVFGANTLLLLPMLDTDGSMMGCVGIFDRRSEILLDGKEISVAHTILSVVANRIKLRVYQRRLEYSRATLEGITDNSGIDIYVNDYNTHEILYVNRSMGLPYGGFEKMRGKKCWEALHEDKTGECDFCPKRRLLDGKGKPSKTYTWDYQRPFDGRWFRVLSSAFRWVDGRMAMVVCSVDITKSKRDELTIREMVFRDTNTGIPNRRKLREDFENFLKEPDFGGKATMIFLDFDDFKKVNDSMGHLEGDLLLTTAARYLQDASPARGHAYRYGGDEFIIFLPGENYDIHTITGVLQARFHEGWDILGTRVTCSISMGVARFPEDGKDYQELIGNADKGMYKAKNDGKGHAWFCGKGKE